MFISSNKKIYDMQNIDSNKVIEQLKINSFK